MKRKLLEQWENNIFSLFSFCLCLVFSPLISPGVYAIPNEELNPFILETPTVDAAGTPNDILIKIRGQLDRIVAEDRHDLIGVRIWGTNNQLLWGHGRAVASIDQTIPFLDAALADQVRAYLTVEVNDFLLNSSHLDTEFSGSIGTAAGETNYGISWTDNGAFLWDALYGLWAYAHYTTDWQRIEDNWSDIQSLYTRCQSNNERAIGTNQGSLGRVNGINSEIAGLMAMARMARHMEDASMETSVVSSAYTRLNAKNDAVVGSTDLPIILIPDTWRELNIDGFNDLTPDLCRFLAAFQKAKITTQINNITNRFRTWYLSDMDHISDWMNRPPFPPVADPPVTPGEEGFQASIFASPIYLSLAYILQEEPQRLRNELPLIQSSVTTPHFLDMFHLQHLVALAHRYSSITWQAE
jgi:hypothetical protein